MTRTMSLAPAKRPRGSALAPPVPYIPRGFSRQEWKFIDTAVSQDLNTTPVLTLLNGLAPGNSASQRIGSKVSFMSLEFRWRARITGTTGVVSNCRFLIVLDRQPNGAAIGAATDVLDAATTTSLRNLANRRRFKIMVDKVFTLGGVLNGAGTGSAIPEMKTSKMYMKFRRPIVTEFNAGVAGTVADIATNSLYLISLGTEAAGNTDGVLYGSLRLRYTDS